MKKKQSACLTILLFVLSVCLSTRLSVRQSVCQNIFLSVHLPVWPSIWLQLLETQHTHLSQQLNLKNYTFYNISTCYRHNIEQLDNYTPSPLNCSKTPQFQIKTKSKYKSIKKSVVVSVYHSHRQHASPSHHQLIDGIHNITSLDTCEEIVFLSLCGGCLFVRMMFQYFFLVYR